MPIQPPPDIPRWAWFAAMDLRNEIERIDDEANDAGQQAQDPEAAEFEWRRQVAGIIAVHFVAGEKIRAALLPSRTGAGPETAREKLSDFGYCPVDNYPKSDNIPSDAGN